MHPGRLFTRLTRHRLKLVRGVSPASVWQVLLARPCSRRSADRTSFLCCRRSPPARDESPALRSPADRDHPVGRSQFAFCGQAIVRLLAPTLDASGGGALPGLCCSSPGDLLSMFCSCFIIDSLAF